MAADEDMIRPIVGSWYKEPHDHEPFEVVAVDEDTGTIEIQYFGGDVDEFEAEDWESLHLFEVDAPHDWTAALEPLDEDDNGQASADFEPSVHRVFRPGYEDEDTLSQFTQDSIIH